MPPRSSPGDAGLPGGDRVLDIEVRGVRGRDGELELECAREVRLETSSPTVLLRIPLDFYRMLRQTDVPDPSVRRIPVDWRLLTRRAFLGLIERGYRVSDFLKSGPSRSGNFYVLTKTG